MDKKELKKQDLFLEENTLKFQNFWQSSNLDFFEAFYSYFENNDNNPFFEVKNVSKTKYLKENAPKELKEILSFGARFSQNDIEKAFPDSYETLTSVAVENKSFYQYLQENSRSLTTGKNALFENLTIAVILKENKIDYKLNPKQIIKNLKSLDSLYRNKIANILKDHDALDDRFLLLENIKNKKEYFENLNEKIKHIYQNNKSLAQEISLKHFFQSYKYYPNFANAEEKNFYTSICNILLDNDCEYKMLIFPFVSSKIKNVPDIEVKDDYTIVVKKEAVQNIEAKSIDIIDFKSCFSLISYNFYKSLYRSLPQDVIDEKEYIAKCQSETLNNNDNYTIELKLPVAKDYVRFIEDIINSKPTTTKEIKEIIKISAEKSLLNKNIEAEKKEKPVFKV